MPVERCFGAVSQGGQEGAGLPQGWWSRCAKCASFQVWPSISLQSPKEQMQDSLAWVAFHPITYKWNHVSA